MISALVFVDVTHPLQLKRASEELLAYTSAPPKWLVSVIVETGIFRAVFSLKPFVSELPAEHWYNRHIRDYFYRSYKTVLDEAENDDGMLLEAEGITTFGNIPLTIITATYPNGVDFVSDPRIQEEYISLHLSNQRELLSLSTHSIQVLAAKSGHYVPLQEPELIVQSIRSHVMRGQ